MQDFCTAALETIKVYRPEITRLDGKSDVIVENLDKVDAKLQHLTVGPCMGLCMQACTHAWVHTCRRAHTHWSVHTNARADARAQRLVGSPCMGHAVHNCTLFVCLTYVEVTMSRLYANAARCAPDIA